MLHSKHHHHDNSRTHCLYYIRSQPARIFATIRNQTTRDHTSQRLQNPVEIIISLLDEHKRHNQKEQAPITEESKNKDNSYFLAVVLMLFKYLLSYIFIHFPSTVLSQLIVQ